jgi:hypothetical protein
MTHSYTFSQSVIAIPWCVGGVLLAGGLILPRTFISMRFKVVLLILGVVALSIVAPDMERDKIEVTSESFYLRTGFWWAPNEHRFLFRDTDKIEIITKPDLKGRPRRFLRANLKNGTHDDVPMGDLFRSHQEAVLAAVADAFKEPAEKSSRPLERVGP